MAQPVDLENDKFFKKGGTGGDDGSGIAEYKKGDVSNKQMRTEPAKKTQKTLNLKFDNVDDFIMPKADRSDLTKSINNIENKFMSSTNVINQNIKTFSGVGGSSGARYKIPIDDEKSFVVGRNSSSMPPIPTVVRDNKFKVNLNDINSGSTDKSYPYFNLNDTSNIKDGEELDKFDEPKNNTFVDYRGNKVNVRVPKDNSFKKINNFDDTFDNDFSKNSNDDFYNNINFKSISSDSNLDNLHNRFGPIKNSNDFIPNVDNESPFEKNRFGDFMYNDKYDDDDEYEDDYDEEEEEDDYDYDEYDDDDDEYYGDYKKGMSHKYINFDEPNPVKNRNFSTLNLDDDEKIYDKFIQNDLLKGSKINKLKSSSLQSDSQNIRGGEDFFGNDNSFKQKQNNSNEIRRNIDINNFNNNILKNNVLGNRDSIDKVKKKNNITTNNEGFDFGHMGKSSGIMKNLLNKNLSLDNFNTKAKAHNNNISSTINIGDFNSSLNRAARGVVGAVDNVISTNNNNNINADINSVNDPVSSGDVEKDSYCYSRTLIYTSLLPKECYDERYRKININRYLEPNREITNDDLRTIVRNNPYLESLDISDCDNIDDFSPLNKLSNLFELSVNNCNNFANLRSIAGCKNLEVLNIGNTKVKNLDGIANFKKLKIFNCSCNSIFNLNTIENCENLVELILWGSFSLNDISAMDSLVNLRLVDIDYTSVEDLFPLAKCSNLEFLFMDNCVRLSDTYTLSALKNLRCLLIDGSSIFLEDQLESISGLVNLEYLTMKFRRINTLKYFSRLNKMKELILEGCNISDLSPIENMVDMKKLDITGNSQVRDLSPIYKMKSLKKLICGGGGSAGKIGGKSASGAVSNMSIDNINVVENLSKLEEINFSYNPRLKDITPMRVCEKVEEIYLQYCTQLEDVSVLGNLKTITKLDLTSCPRIKDLYFLRNLTNLLELQYNGTVVSTPGLATILRAGDMYLLKGNDAELLSKATLASGKKKSKLQKSLRKYFSVEKKDDK